MARDLTAGFITEIDARQLRVEFFVNLYFDSGDVFAWTGIGPIDWDGNTYSGVGNMASFGAIEESKVIKANGTVMVLSGVPSSLISIALQEKYRGRRAEIYLAVLDGPASIVPDPFRVFGGKMDVMEYETDGQTASISVKVENDLIDLFKPKLRNYTPEDQKKAFPGDKGLDFIPFIQDQEVVWKEKLKK